MFSEIILIDYARPLAQRAKARKSVGPYRWRPTAPGTGRGFYQASQYLEMDPHGSTLALRLDYAVTHRAYHGRTAGVRAFACDPDGFDTLTPIIARLPKGRGFLAGWTMGEGMCASLDATIWPDIEDAARAAYDLAESDAERSREAQEAEEGDED